jgi:hypothetical protein
VRIRVGAYIYGLPVITATDDNAGAIRIMIDGTVKALQHY